MNRKDLFPLQYRDNFLPEAIRMIQYGLDDLLPEKDAPRLVSDKKDFLEIARQWAFFPRDCAYPTETARKIMVDLCGNIPRWRSPNLFYNVGAPVNTEAMAAYCVAMDENIYAINHGLAGNALAAEIACTKIATGLTGVPNARGLFVFGGSATILYGIKVGLKKACFGSAKTGTPQNVVAFLPEDAHFAHANAVDWLGIGTDNIVAMETNADRTTDIQKAECMIRKSLEEKKRIAVIALNGGTTYNHTIDAIKDFVDLRDRLVIEYRLDYKPHIHVDTVIGWAWLVFAGYDFEENELGLDTETLLQVKRQYERIRDIRFADSWGVDFHKAVGSCPVSSSMFILNNGKEIELLKKGKGATAGIHQVAQAGEVGNFDSPCDYTLETSRPAGASMAALVSIHTLGVDGYRRNLANSVDFAVKIRKLLNREPDLRVANGYSLGFATMFRAYPPRMVETGIKEMDLKEETPAQEIEQVNDYMKKFLVWDYETRVSKNIGLEFSYSPGFSKLKNGVKIFSGKIYSVSPHCDEKKALELLSTIRRQKDKFDKEFGWNERKEAITVRQKPA